jgi:hypothetical protein
MTIREGEDQLPWREPCGGAQKRVGLGCGIVPGISEWKGDIINGHRGYMSETGKHRFDGGGLEAAEGQIGETGP